MNRYLRGWLGLWVVLIFCFSLSSVYAMGKFSPFKTKCPSPEGKILVMGEGGYQGEVWRRPSCVRSTSYEITVLCVEPGVWTSTHAPDQTICRVEYRHKYNGGYAAHLKKGEARFLGMGANEITSGMGKIKIINVKDYY